MKITILPLLTRLSPKSICAIFLAIAPAIFYQSALGDQQDAFKPVGTWYLSLDAGPFGPPFAGLALSGVASFHADKTLMFVDAGDFGSLGTKDGPQLGTWQRNGNTLRARTLFISFDPVNGEPLFWQRATFELQRGSDRNHMVGFVNVEILSCGSSPPAPGALLCPDPILESDAFMPSGPADIPIEFRRLIVD